MRRLVLLCVLLCACQRAKPVVWLGGDVHLGTGDASVLAALKPVVGEGVGIVNLEGPVGTAPADAPGLHLANGPAGVESLKKQGIRVVGVANNHMDDLGGESRKATLDGVAKAGLLATPTVLEVSGAKLVVTQHDLTKGVPANLAEELKTARKQGDLMISMFHVTGPALYLPRPELRDAVAIALDAGAGVIAGHGTHAVGPVERRGDAVIAWGLGNLAFACDCTDEEDGLVLLLTLDGAKVAEAGVVPISAGLQGKPLSLAANPEQVFDLLEAIGTKPLRRDGARAWLSP